MKPRYCQAYTALAAVVIASAPLLPVSAQMTQRPDPNAPRLVVEVFRSADKNAGVQVADAVRTRISQDVSVRQLWVLPKQDITANLEASGFSTTEALAMNDARALAQLLRGDVFIVGDVARDSAGSGYQVAAHYILTRDAALVQPLGTFRVSKPDQATGAISKEFQNAQKAFVAERNCVNRAREGKYAEAIAEAKKGIAAYPNTTLARICLANAMQEQKASPDSILAVTSEILRIDPKSKPALTVAYTALKAAKRPNDATDVLLKLVGADPSNTRLLEQVIEEFAINGQAAKAIPFVDQLVRDNPGEPNHLQLQMKIHLTAKDYKGGIAAGEELTKADTAAATPELFLRLIGAAQLAEMNDKALDLIRQAVGKYPNNVELLRTQVGMLVKAGKNAEALEAVRRALAANPKAPGLNTTLGTIFVSMNQPDSAVAAAQAALAAGDSASSVAPVLVAAGQAFLKASKTADDYRKPISVLELANKTSETPAGHLLLGQAQFSLGYAFYQDVQKLARSQSKGDRAAACEAAKGAQMAFGVAQIEIPAGGRASPQAAQQLLSNLGQLSPATDQAAKVLCAGK